MSDDLQHLDQLDAILEAHHGHKAPGFICTGAIVLGFYTA